MPIPTIDLLEDLKRLDEESEQFPKANDVIRDGNYSVNTYYNRFGWNWRDVEAAYSTWEENNEIADEYKLTDWHSFHQKLETETKPTS